MSAVRTWCAATTLLLTTLVGQAHAAWSVRSTAALFDGHEVIDLAVWGDRFILAVGDDGTASVVDTLTWQPLLDSANQSWFDICTDGTDVDEVVDVVEGGSSAPGFLVVCKRGQLTEVNVTDGQADVVTSTVESVSVPDTSESLVAASRKGDVFYLLQEDGGISSFVTGAEETTSVVGSVSGLSDRQLDAFQAFAIGDTLRFAIGDDEGKVHLVTEAGAVTTITCRSATSSEGLTDLVVMGDDLLGTYRSGSSQDSIAFIDTGLSSCDFPEGVNSKVVDPTSLSIAVGADTDHRLYVSGINPSSTEDLRGVVSFSLGSLTSLSEVSYLDRKALENGNVGDLASTSADADYTVVRDGTSVSLLSARPFVRVTVEIESEDAASRASELSRVLETPTETPTEAPSETPTSSADTIQKVVVRFETDEEGPSEVKLFVGTMSSAVETATSTEDSQRTFSFLAADLPQGPIFAQVDVSVGDVVGSSGAYTTLDQAPDLEDVSALVGDSKVVLTFESGEDDISGYEIVMSETAFISPGDFIAEGTDTSISTFVVAYGGDTYTWPTAFNASSTEPGAWPLVLASDSELVTNSLGTVTITLFPLNNGTSYWVALRPVDSGGQAGSWSEVFELVPNDTISSAEWAGETGGFCSLTGRGHTWSDLSAWGVLGLIFLRRGRRAPRTMDVGGM